MPTVVRPLAAAAAVIALAGCAALSGPGRSLPLESPATLERGQVSVQASGGYGIGLGIETGVAAVRARFGAEPHLEAQLEATYGYLDYEDFVGADELSPHVGAGRVGLKVAPVEHVSFVAGLAIGTHALGSYGAPDIGIIAGYENPYIVPWTALRAFASLPIDVRRVIVETGTTTTADGMTMTTDWKQLVPPNSGGWQLSTGFRIPVVLERGARDRDDDGLADDEREVRVDILGGVGWLQMFALEDQGSVAVFQAELALEFVLDP